MPIDLAQVAKIAEWTRDQIGVAHWFKGFFNHQAPPATPGVAAGRITVTSIFEANGPPNWTYAELYSDGAGFACHRLSDPRQGRNEHDQKDSWIWNETLLFELARCVSLLGRHAGENCGAWGDAVVATRVVSSKPTRLTYLAHQRFPEPIAGGRELQSPVEGHHTAVIEGLARPSSTLLATTRILATDLFHAYGSPEVRHLTADGMLRIRYFVGDQNQLRHWAANNGIEVTDETVE